MSKLDWSKAKQPAGGYSRVQQGSTRKSLTERQQLIKYAETAIFACCRTINSKQPELSRDEVFSKACAWMTNKLIAKGHQDARVIVGHIKARRR